jgi:hypothetical protein
VRINDFEHLIQEIKSKALSSSDEYISLMKTVGNNYKYDFTSQLSIYNQNTSARACGEFDFWRKKFGRTVKRGEKGIPIYKNYGFDDYSLQSVSLREALPQSKNGELFRYSCSVI